MNTLPPSSAVRILPLCALAALAACNGDGTASQRLTPGQVQGVYSVCSLRFTPTQTAFPVANLLATVVNTTPPAPKQPPSLTLGGQANVYQLIYTRRSDNFLQQLNGSVDLRQSEVAVDFPDESQSEVVRELLLPPALAFTFADGPKRLTSAGSLTYSVRRSDYARAAAISEVGLQERISGRLDATFTTGACP
ncbi:MAG TPA: hypothetical protein VGO40_16360 [Longimicrobium sp.]|nr:hypothetical protein [Longimicrobium sp.]